ncbi:Pyruvate carboxylase [Thermodesulfatator indicus DSM 15286]|uniref:biotin carboxylase n=1 Tax=Thermodesulfatator indicus (strain DSM 15286 / JCM 11887 / CIR29812) TaxID=667014 RepID=F8ACR1_THEID|nr:biotin carboxylase N-terminal domain-containing protein [Thermodesulfatator indicus]AEH45842.1 Pyruvate carboxylase [Thermodesulfatator indicus DSM 15286]
MKERVLIANRGEIALRIMEACEALGIDYVAVYAPGDEQSLHVKLPKAKGKPCFRISSYRDANDILAVADEAKCTAIHPGYGFFSEDFRFARRVVKRNNPLIFIGPRWEVIRDLGHKLMAKQVANEIGVPVIPGTINPVYNEIEAEAKAEELFLWQEEQGFEPRILIKAAAGGGGMGIEEVDNLDMVRPVFRRIRAYAKRLFGDDGVLIEVFIRDFHHIELQVLGNQFGELVHFGTRNCTIQVHRQKRIEVAPGFDPAYTDYPFDAEKVLESIVNHSLKLAAHVGYDSVGTWEWLVTRDGKHYFMEVNTRIQVENEISARISRIKGKEPNLLMEQIRAAFGEKLGYKQKDISFEGTSIEFRLIAEDVKRGFKPLSGTITRFEYPEREWLRVRTHVPQDEPYRIPTEFDPNLALGIIWGKDTPQAMERGFDFLNSLIIEGETAQGEPLATNVPYLKEKLPQILKFL